MANCLVNFRGQISFTKHQQNLQIKEKCSFPFAINIKWLLKRQCTKIQLSQKHYWEILKSLTINIDCEFW